MFDDRWSYWLRTLENGRPLNDSSIPKIDFDSRPHPDTIKNLKDCIRFIQFKGHGSREAWSLLIEWILWGFGTSVQKEFPERITEEISWNLYKTFNLGLMLKYPADHMAWGSCEIAGMAHSGNGTGYFPTPQHIVKMMVQITISESDKIKTFNEPCCGTGTMLLEASNYCLRLYAQDIDLNMVKMATVNAWIYIPWLACPGDGWIDWNTQEDYQKAVNNFKEWEKEKVSKIPLLTHIPKTDSLKDWF